ncbi:MAG: hypothetical protein ACRCX7_11155 [Cetobacterium sp.]|uniref:hypothetical protein n=1 Tax=Cetobacterium sp. TaxID=2071632 RepID=UPI003F2EEBD7
MAHKNFYVGIDLNGNTIKEVGAGILSTDAVNKGQLDAAIDSVLEMVEVHYEEVVDLVDSVAKTVTHNLGKRFVQVSVYDSTGLKVEVDVTCVDANNISLLSTVDLTDINVVVSV